MILTGGAYIDKCDITSNVVIRNNAVVYGSMSVNGNFYNPRIGLGYMGSYLESNNGPDIIQAQNYNDNSDLRIKKDIKAVDNALEIIKKISVKQFNYNYGIQNLDEKPVFGCIAQEVEAIDSDLVYHSDGFLPDVQQYATITGNVLRIHTELTPMVQWKVGDMLKLINKNMNEYHTVRIVEVVDAGTLLIDGVVDGVYFVYGRGTRELKNVDYKQLFVLAIKAIQELSERLS
jgi:hypothetical protein